MGPLHASPPRLVLRGLYSDPPIVGSDSTVYGFLDSGTRHARLAAVGPDRRIRWTSTPALPVWWSAEPPDPYPALAPTGAISFGGGACPRPKSILYSGTAGCLTTVGADGQPRTHVTTYGLTKGGPRLLVGPDGTLVRATIGPYSGFADGQAADDAQRNVTVFAPSGTTRRLGAGCAWANTALGADGTLYAATAAEGRERQSCLPSGSPTRQGNSTVMAFTPAGSRVWSASLPAYCAAASLSTNRGRLYIATSCADARVYALSAHGHVLWVAHGFGSGFPALAVDRTSGDAWLADGGGVERLTPTGAPRWRRPWRRALGDRVALALDARGVAYACGDDGLLRALSPDGRLLWQRQLAAPPYGFTSPPTPAVGPDGALYVSDTGAAEIVSFAP